MSPDTMKLFAIVAVALFSTQMMFSQALWQDLSAGMTEAQVHGLHPEKEVEVLKEIYELQYSFGKSDNLRWVKLSGRMHEREKGESFEQRIERTRRLASSVQAALNLKYGPMAASETRANGDSLYSWHKDGTLIELLVMWDIAKLNIIYSVEADSRSEKL